MRGTSGKYTAAGLLHPNTVAKMSLTPKVFYREMSVEDAIELGRRSIYHATFRDAVSGGTVSGKHYISMCLPHRICCT